MKGAKKHTPRLQAISGSRSRHKTRDREMNDLADALADNEVLPPDYLDELEAKKFNELSERLLAINILSRQFIEIQALCAQKLAEVETLSKIIKEEGLTYITKSVNKIDIRKQNPAVPLREKAQRHVQSLLSEIGLTHTSVSRTGAKVQRPKTKRGNDFAEF